MLIHYCKALPYSADMDAHCASQPIHPGPSPRNPKVRSRSSPPSSMSCYLTTCDHQLESPFAINLLCLWGWSMEGYHGSIWIRPAARSSGKIVSLCCPQFSFNCVDWNIKLSKIIFPKPQSPHWSCLRGIKAAGWSHFRCSHKPLVFRAGSR